MSSRVGICVLLVFVRCPTYSKILTVNRTSTSVNEITNVLFLAFHFDVMSNLEKSYKIGPRKPSLLWPAPGTKSMSSRTLQNKRSPSVCWLHFLTFEPDEIRDSRTFVSLPFKSWIQRKFSVHMNGLFCSKKKSWVKIRLLCNTDSSFVLFKDHRIWAASLKGFSVSNSKTCSWQSLAHFSHLSALAVWNMSFIWILFL